MARNALYRVTVFVEREALCSERYALIEFHVVADDACCPDYDARAVVDGEIFSYLCPRVDVDARLRVCHFRQDSRNEGHAEEHQFVGDAIVSECLYNRVARDNLPYIVGCRVAVVCGYDIGGKYCPYFRQATDERDGYFVGCFLS